jgi:cytochrome c553
VGCEACHGPAAAHLADPGRPYGKTGLASCTSCHTAEMDPTFNYYQDRQRVMHGTRSP